VADLRIIRAGGAFLREMLAFPPALRHCRFMPTETLLLALTTYFATIGPADLTLVFAALTRKNTASERRTMALRGVLVATGILIFFALFGNALLGLFGVSLPALRTAGGILLLLISIDMVFARHSGGTGTTPEEENEAETREDISVFPLAMPLIAGPGSISATILLTTGTGGDQVKWLLVIAAMLIILAVSYVFMLIAIPMQRLLGLTGLSVVSRIIGVLLAALSVQFIFDGIRTSGLIPGIG
jgi:multiple antibiotic resistance protein